LLVAELRQSQDEARERSETAVTPGHYYGALITKHMRLAQVATESKLAPIHHELACVNKKREARNTHQIYFNTLVSNSGRAHLQLPIMAGMSEKLHTASWYCPNIDDLRGISTFMLGGAPARKSRRKSP
jgi:hypothetical protein